MPKKPPNTPTKGDRCKFRGRHVAIGTVIKVDSGGGDWVTVLWDDWYAPQLCHLYELEAVTEFGAT